MIKKDIHLHINKNEEKQTEIPSYLHSKKLINVNEKNIKIVYGEKKKETKYIWKQKSTAVFKKVTRD